MNALNSSHERSQSQDTPDLAPKSMSSWFTDLTHVRTEQVRVSAPPSLPPLNNNSRAQVGAVEATQPDLTSAVPPIAAEVLKTVEHNTPASAPVEVITSKMADGGEEMEVDKEEGELSSDEEAKHAPRSPARDHVHSSSVVEKDDVTEATVTNHHEMQHNGDATPTKATAAAISEVTSSRLVSPRVNTEPILEQLSRAVGRGEVLLHSPQPSGACPADSTSRVEVTCGEKRPRSRSPSPVVSSSGTHLSTPDASRNGRSELENGAQPNGADVNGISPVASAKPVAQPPSKKKVKYNYLSQL